MPYSKNILQADFKIERCIVFDLNWGKIGSFGTNGNFLGKFISVIFSCLRPLIIVENFKKIV